MVDECNHGPFFSIQWLETTIKSSAFLKFYVKISATAFFKKDCYKKNYAWISGVMKTKNIIH